MGNKLVISLTKENTKHLQKGIFAYGVRSSSKVSMSNLVNSSGVVASDVTGVGTARLGVRGTTYGGDKGIFAFGNPAASGDTAVSNLVNNVDIINL